MSTVNKPILLDETGKDIASAVREQTEALQRAIQAISVGGGGGSGGGDDGYFPVNQVELGMDGPVSALDGSIFFKIYDPATSDLPPPKYISVMAMEDDNVYIVTPVCTKDELEQWDGSPSIPSSGGVLVTVSMSGITAQTGIIPVPKADKPLWLGFDPSLFAMATMGFY